MKTAIVTGGAKRVGAAICRHLSEVGYRVLVHCSHSVREAEALAREIGGEVYSCDLRNLEAASALLDFSEKAFGEMPSLLVNNASIYRRDDFSSMTLESLLESLRVNAFAPFELMQKFAFRVKSKASIVNLLDQRIAGVDVYSASYSLSKKLLAEMTQMAALSYASRQIRVNAVAPGYVLPPEGVGEEAMKRFAEASPLGCRTHEEQVARCVAFLAENETLTGQVIYADAGLHIHNSDIGEKRVK